MAGDDNVKVQFIGSLQDADPTLAVTVAHKIEGTIHAGVAGEEDLLLWQVAEAVSPGMRRAKIHEFQPALAVVEDHAVRKEQRRRLGARQAKLANILASFGSIFPPLSF